MSSNLLHKIERSKEALENTLKLASELDDFGDEDLKKYSELSEKLVMVQKNTELHREAMAKSSNLSSFEDFDKSYAGFLKSNRITDVKNLKEYKDMIDTAKDYIDAAKGGDVGTVNTVFDGDLEVEENIPTVDPLTKKPLQNPVRNKICKHVYDKMSMLEAIRVNPRVRCPQVGCGNKNFIQTGHLVEDKELKRKLMLIHARERNNAMETDSD